MELIVIRHALPGSGVDPVLAREGRRQALLLAAFLDSREELRPERLYTSPMRRAVETARPLAEALGCRAVVDPRLAEFDLGAPYLPPERRPDDKAAQWRALESGRWGEHTFDPDAFEHRVLAAFDDVIARNPGLRVAVVCHSGVLNAFLGRLLGRSRGMFVAPDHTSFSRVLAAPDGTRQLRSINETPHLLASPHVPGATVTDLLVLHALRLTGMAPAATLVARTGLDPGAVDDTLAAAAAAGLVTERTGRLPGWMLTANGRAEHARLLAAELEASRARPAVERVEKEFLDLNLPFKQLCTRWQVRPDGSPNDHADPGYDRAVVDELGALHPRAVAVTAELAEALPRFGRYPDALSRAWRRVDAGEVRAFAAPLQDSYHDVWMELHQDLLSTLGRERSAADGH